MPMSNCRIRLSGLHSTADLTGMSDFAMVAGTASELHTDFPTHAFQYLIIISIFKISQISLSLN